MFRRIAAEIRERAEAICAAQPGTPIGVAQRLALKGAGGVPTYDLGRLGAPDTWASEHLVWYSPANDQVIKATGYGRFGHDFDRAVGGGLPADYLERMAWAREVLDDTVTLIGWSCDEAGAPGVLTAQRFVAGHERRPNPTSEEIGEFLAERGFVLRPDVVGRYRRETDGVEVDDAHAANLIRDVAGRLVAIDLLIRGPGR